VTLLCVALLSNTLKYHIVFIFVTVDLKISVIINIIIVIINVSFMQGIYTHIPETNHVLREYIVADIPSLLFMVPLSLVLCWLFCTFTLAL